MALNPNKTDPLLGDEIHKHLLTLRIETPTVSDLKEMSDKAKITRISGHFEKILLTLGLDLEDDSLRESADRVAKMFVNEIFWGLDPKNFPKCTTIENRMGYDEMVLERGIGVMSVCEHHFVTINGKAHVAYIPGKKVLGLSKMNRVVEYFARRPQVQERLTEQVYEALAYILDTQDVAVVIDAEHFCVKMRGVEDPHSTTFTSKLGGKFREPALRAEFMSLIGM